MEQIKFDNQLLLPVLGGLDVVGLDDSDSAATDSINAGRFAGDLLGIGAIITTNYKFSALSVYCKM